MSSAVKRRASSPERATKKQKTTVETDDNTCILYQDTNGRTAHMKQTRSWRCLLSLDGGGIRGLSQIAILNEISKRIMFDLKLDEAPRLCDYFDIIGGVGTGGLLATFIGRLGLTVPQANDEYSKVMDYVSSAPVDGTRLDSLMKAMVKKYTGSSGTLMYDPSSQTNHCKTFVGVVSVANASRLVRFRSYQSRKGQEDNLPIWQVARATLTYSGLLSYTLIGPELTPIAYVSGELRWNNPSKEVIREFEAQWTRQSIACFASIGSGHQGVIRLDTSGASNTSESALEQMAMDSQRVAEEIAHRFRGQKNYFRLNVEQGLQRNDGQKALTLDDVVVHTSAYLDSAWVDSSVDHLIRSLLEACKMFPWQTTRDGFEQVMDEYLANARSRTEGITIDEIQRGALHFVSTLELIRKTDCNEEEWLNLAKFIDSHLTFFGRDVFSEMLEPLSADPLWAPTNKYLMELRKVQSNVEELIARDPDQIWDSRTRTGESLLSNWAADLKGRFKDIKSALHSEVNTSSRRQEQERAKEKIADKLSPLQPHRRHQDVKMKRSKGTGTWFLNSLHFKTWSAIGDGQTAKALCGFGEPGAGKTMICSSVIEYLDELKIAVAYLYCDYRDQLIQTAANMIGSLAKQLVMQMRPMARAAWETYRQNIKGQSAQDIMTQTVAQFDGVYICIDALDECEPETRKELLKLLKTVAGASVRVFLTGRQSVEAEVVNALGDLSITTIRIVANEEDIRLCLSESIADDPYNDIMDDELKVQIMETIVQRCHGIFLVAVLQVQAVLEHDTKRGRKRALTQIPIGLSENYTTTLERIRRQSETKAQRAASILTWLYYAERPLRVEELRYALAVRPGDTAFDRDAMSSERALIDCCIGLVVIEPETSTVRLTHFTLQEYFNGHRDALLPSGHAMIAEICLTYLNFSHAGKSRKEIELSSPFIKYVGTHLGNHLQKGSTSMLDEKTVVLLHKQDNFYILERFLQEFLPFQYFQEYQKYPQQEEVLQTLPLHWAAFFGTSSIARLLMSGVDAINAKDSPVALTPLHYAARTGQVEMIKLLTNTPGVDVNSRDYYGWTPLETAADNGHDAVVQLLVNTPGVDVNAGDDLSRTPLWMAAYSGQDAVVQLLIGTPGVDVNARDTDGSTPLFEAAFHGHDAIVQLLVNTPGVDINARDKNDWTPLWAAADNGQDAIVQLLVNTPGVDVNARNKDGLTPLSIAARREWNAIVKLLVDTPGVDVNARESNGRTPLCEAAAAGHRCDATVQLLVNAPGVDVNARDNDGRTPLSRAAERGRHTVVQLPVNNPGVDVNARDNDGRTPLLIASQANRHDIVQLLINVPGVDVSGIDIDTISDKNERRLFPEATSEDRESASMRAVDNQE